MLFILSFIVGCVLADEAIVFADFEEPTWPSGWVASDDFPFPGPVTREEATVNPKGFAGERLASTSLGADSSLGNLTSPEFVITKKYVHLLVGGGNHPDETYVGLFINGTRVASSTGAWSDTLAPDVWNISQYVGQTAHIRVIDTSTGSWGFIMVDDIIFSDSPTMARTHLNTGDHSPFHDGLFQGWGSALCWWANRVGYSSALTEQAADLFYSKNGLRLDIARYNVGGGDDPKHNHITRSDSKIPGYATGFAAGGSDEIVYDWTADENQRNVLAAALKANPDLYVEGFSNSPPWFMTVSGCSAGAADPLQDNLKPEYYKAFAQYIADVTVHFRNVWKVPFQSYSPMNEPDTDYWQANSTKQEGCHFDRGTSESEMLLATRAALDSAGLQDVVVAGMDETSIDSMVKNLDLLSKDALAALGRIDTHTYSGNERPQLQMKAMLAKKDLWMSETDSGGVAGGADAGGMGAGLELAELILKDMNQMQPAAWVLWNLLDVHRDSKFTAPDGSHPEADTKIDQNGGLWGVGLADHDAQQITLSQKYYVLGQFTRFIRPGDTIIATNSEHVLAAYNQSTQAVKIVVVNSKDTIQNFRFDLTNFDIAPAGVLATVVRTSGSFEGGEHWSQLASIPINHRAFSWDATPNSVTTFVIE